MKVTANLPKDEVFDLKSNMRRAARSSTRNIAEGFGRHHHGENIQHCRISRGSLFEVMDDIITAYEEKYLSPEEYKYGRQLVDRAINITNGYIKYLNSLL